MGQEATVQGANQRVLGDGSVQVDQVIGLSQRQTSRNKLLVEGLVRCWVIVIRVDGHRLLIARLVCRREVVSGKVTVVIEYLGCTPIASTWCAEMRLRMRPDDARDRVYNFVEVFDLYDARVSRSVERW